jgi:hypothetical protein
MLSEKIKNGQKKMAVDVFTKAKHPSVGYNICI